MAMKVLLGMSGGVDSAYAVIRLREMGYEVEGAIIKMHEYTELDSAKKCAAELSVPLHVISGEAEFSSIVKQNLVTEYSSGRTPNPCIICNERVKFRLLADYAERFGIDRIATGHYARVVRIDGAGATRHAVAMSESEKDQSYMLYRLPEDILSKLILPLADMKKQDVRAACSEAGLSSSEKKDSMEICFLPNGRHYEFVEAECGSRHLGNFVNTRGEVLGPHDGICRYTVGQRKGLGISLGERVFVTDINPITNDITLSDSFPGVTETRISDVVFSGISMDELATGDVPELYVRVRYTAPLVKCTARLLEDGEVLLSFSTPLRIAKGQSAVLYHDGRVMLGGIIKG